MDDRLAVISVIIHDNSVAGQVNNLFHQYSEKIIARMGVPYREYGINIISVVMHTSGDDISTLAGKLGKLPGVKAKSVQVPIIENTQKDNK